MTENGIEDVLNGCSSLKYLNILKIKLDDSFVFKFLETYNKVTTVGPQSSIKVDYDRLVLSISSANICKGASSTVWIHQYGKHQKWYYRPHSKLIESESNQMVLTVDPKTSDKIMMHPLRPGTQLQGWNLVPNSSQNPFVLKEECDPFFISNAQFPNLVLFVELVPTESSSSFIPLKGTRHKVFLPYFNYGNIQKLTQP